MKFLRISLLILLMATGCDSRRTDFNVLKLAVDENPTTLDPALIVDVAGGSISAKIFNGLVRVDKDLKVTPDIAQSWRISADGRIYTFKIRKDVKFHNGRVLTPQDFKYSFERVLTPQTGSSRNWIFEKINGAREFSAGLKSEVIGIKVIDGETLVIELERPFEPFLWILTMPNAYVVPMEEVEKWGIDFSSHSVGTGPFKLREWRQDYSIYLAADKTYFGEKPKVDFIEYRIIPDPFSSFAEFESGNLDIIAVPKSEYKRLSADEKFKRQIYSRTGLNIYYLGFNCSKPPFNNPDVRRAINYAIDREKIAAAILEGRVVPAKSVLPPELVTGKDVPAGYPYNPDMAVKLLKKAGIRDGFELNIYQNKTKEAANILEAVQDYLKKAGINAHIVEREWSSFKEAVIKGDADMFLLSWWADYPDPENFFFPNFHSSNFGAGGNKAFFSNLTVDKMIETARETVDETKKEKIYSELDKAIFDEAPWVFMWHKKEFVMVQPWVKGYYLYPIYNSDKGNNIAIDRNVNPKSKHQNPK